MAAGVGRGPWKSRDRWLNVWCSGTTGGYIKSVVQVDIGGSRLRKVVRLSGVAVENGVVGAQNSKNFLLGFGLVAQKVRKHGV